MATRSVSDTNLKTTAGPSLKKKYVKKRSKAYKKRRSLRRKKTACYTNKRLHRYFVRRTKKLKMNNFKGQMVNRPADKVRSSDHRCHANEELGYWKAHALSLQYVNDMLTDYIGELHSRMFKNADGHPIEHEIATTTYEDDGDHEPDCEDEEVLETDDDDEEFNKESRLFRMERDKKRQQQQQDPSGKAPEKSHAKIREEQMEQLYGHDWRKIMGMETVVQLNYDILLDKQKINYWPILPINI